MEAWGELEDGGLRSEQFQLQITTITRKNNNGYLNYGIDNERIEEFSTLHSHSCTHPYTRKAIVFVNK